MTSRHEYGGGWPLNLKCIILFLTYMHIRIESRKNMIGK